MGSYELSENQWGRHQKPQSSWHYRAVKTPYKKPTDILAPANAKNLAQLVEDFNSKEAPWVACGLGTRLDWGPAIKQPSQPISVRNLNNIIEHSIEDLTITVEAGMSLSDVQAVLGEHQQWLPFAPSLIHSCP